MLPSKDDKNYIFRSLSDKQCAWWWCWTGWWWKDIGSWKKKSYNERSGSVRHLNLPRRQRTRREERSLSVDYSIWFNCTYLSFVCFHLTFIIFYCTPMRDVGLNKQRYYYYLVHTFLYFLVRRILTTIKYFHFLLVFPCVDAGVEMGDRFANGLC